MGIGKLPSGAWRARVQAEGRRLDASFATEQEARDWELLTRAQAVSGRLPSSTTVAEYATRWLAGCEQAPANTREFHGTNIDAWVLPGLVEAGVTARFVLVEPDCASLGSLADMLVGRTLRVVVGEQRPLAQMAVLHEIGRRGGPFGKLVATVE